MCVHTNSKRIPGIQLEPSTLSEFITFLTSSPHSHAVSFEEFRDFLLLMPREASPEEIFRYYEVRKFLGDDGRGAARVNMEGDALCGIRDVRTADSMRKVMSHLARKTLHYDNRTSHRKARRPYPWTTKRPTSRMMTRITTSTRRRRNHIIIGLVARQQPSSY